MKKTQSGLALIVVLIFIEIFTLLGVYALQNNFIQQHTLKNNWQKLQLLQTAWQALAAIEKQMLWQIPTCVITNVSDSDLLVNPDKWWQIHACQLVPPSYYVIESLGRSACTVVMGSPYSVDYYRITVNVTAANGARSVVQETWAQPSMFKSLCKITRNIKNGWQTKVILV